LNWEECYLNKVERG